MMEPPLYVLAELSAMDELNAPLNRSARLRYTCMSVSKKYIALGSNTGGAYIFTRDTLKYLQVIFGEVESSSVGVVSLSQATDNHVAFTTSSGQVVVMEMNLEKRLKPERVRLSNDHAGYTVTALQWNKTGNKLFIGDNSGKVTVAHVPLTKASVLFNQPTEMIARLESTIVQIDYNQEKLLVSTLTRCYLFSTQSENVERSITARFIKTRHKYSQIGKKLRDGEFGACFFVEPSSNIPVIYCSRPGSRMWEVDFEGNVLNTHQFKKLLSISSTPVIYFHKTSLVTEFSSSTVVSPSVNFKKMYTIGQYIVTWCNTGLYVFDTINVKVILWSYDIQDIEDLCVYENSVFIFHSDQSIQHLYLFKLEKCINHLVTKKYWLMAANTLSYFKQLHLKYLRSKISHQTVKNVILNINRQEHRHLINSLSELIIVHHSTPTPDTEGHDELNHQDHYPNHSDTNSVTSFDSTLTSDSGSEVVSPLVSSGVHESDKQNNSLINEDNTLKDNCVASEAPKLNLFSDNQADISIVSTDLESEPDKHNDSELSGICIDVVDSSAENAIKHVSKTIVTKEREFSLENSLDTSNDTAEVFSFDAHSTPKNVKVHEEEVYLQEHSDHSLLNSSQEFSNDTNNIISNNSARENKSQVSDKEHLLVEKSGSSMLTLQNENETSTEKPQQILSSAEYCERNEPVIPEQLVSNDHSEKNCSSGNSKPLSVMNEVQKQPDYKDTPVAVIPEIDDDIIVQMKSKNSLRRRKVNEIDLSNSPGLTRSASVKSKTKKRELKTKRSVSVPALDNINMMIKMKDTELERDTVSLCSMEDIERASTPDTLQKNQQQFKDSDTISLNSLEENSSETVLPLIKRLSLSGITASLDEQQKETSSSVDSLNNIDSPSGSLSQSPRVSLMAVKDSLAMKLKKGKTFIKTMKEKSQLSKSPTVPDNSFTDSVNEEPQIVMSTLDEQIVKAKGEEEKLTEVPKVLPKTDIRNLVSATEEAQIKLQDIQVMLNPALLSQTLNDWVTILNKTYRNLQTETKVVCSNDNTEISENIDADATNQQKANASGASSASNTSTDTSKDTKWCNTFDPFGLDVDLLAQVSELTKLCFQTCCHGNVSAYISPNISSSCDKESIDTDALYLAQIKCNNSFENVNNCDQVDCNNHKLHDEINCDNLSCTGDQNRCECHSQNCSSTNNSVEFNDSANEELQAKNRTLADRHQTINDASEIVPDIQNHSGAPDKGHELQMSALSISETHDRPSLNDWDKDTNFTIDFHQFIDANSVLDPRQQLDQELSVFVRCYYCFLGTNVIRQFLYEQKDILFKTWLSLIECCQELGLEDPIKMYIDQHDVNDALDHLRSGIFKYKDAFLGHYASIFGMSVYKCIEFGKDVPNKVSPLDILNLCHHYNKPTHQYLLKYIMLRYKETPEYNRFKTLQSICEHPEVKLEILKCLLTRKDGLKYDKPSPGGHLVKWTHHKMINDVLNMINNKQEDIKAEKICEEYGYWLGCLRLIDTDTRWRDVIHLICCLGDINLLCTNNDFGFTPKSTEEWKYLLQEVLKLESENGSRAMVSAVPDFIPSLTLENTASVLVDHLGPHIAAKMLQELSLEDDRSLTIEFCQKCICKALTQAQQGVVIHNMLEKLNTYLWSKKPQNMAPQIHYAVNGEISNVRSPTDSTMSSSFQTQFSRLSAQGRMIQLGLEDAECHWGIQTQINSECSNCNQYLYITVSHMEPGALIFQCGHAFHKYCVSRQECPLC